MWRVCVYSTVMCCVYGVHLQHCAVYTVCIYNTVLCVRCASTTVALWQKGRCTHWNLYLDILTLLSWNVLLWECLISCFILAMNMAFLVTVSPTLMIVSCPEYHIFVDAEKWTNQLFVYAHRLRENWDKDIDGMFAFLSVYFAFNYWAFSFKVPPTFQRVYLTNIRNSNVIVYFEVINKDWFLFLINIKYSVSWFLFFNYKIIHGYIIFAFLNFTYLCNEI